MSKRKLLYYYFLSEESIAYYLTYKWSLLPLAGIIALFPTVMLWWALQAVSNFGISWELIFFVVWLITLLVFIIEFPIPEEIKRRVKQKFDDKS